MAGRRLIRASVNVPRSHSTTSVRKESNARWWKWIRLALKAACWNILLKQHLRKINIIGVFEFWDPSPGLKYFSSCNIEQFSCTLWLWFPAPSFQKPWLCGYGHVLCFTFRWITSGMKCGLQLFGLYFIRWRLNSIDEFSTLAKLFVELTTKFSTWRKCVFAALYPFIRRWICTYIYVLSIRPVCGTPLAQTFESKATGSQNNGRH